MQHTVLLGGDYLCSVAQGREKPARGAHPDNLTPSPCTMHPKVVISYRNGAFQHAVGNPSVCGWSPSALSQPAWVWRHPAWVWSQPAMVWSHPTWVWSHPAYVWSNTAWRWSPLSWSSYKINKRKIYIYTKSHNSDRCLCRTTDSFYKDHIFVY